MILHATPDYRPEAGGIYYAMRDVVEMERGMGLDARVWAMTGDNEEDVVSTDRIGWSEVQVVHLCALWHPEHARQWSQSRKNKKPHVLSPHGMFEPYILNRNYWTKKWPARLLYQDRIIREALWIQTTSEMERDNLLRYFPQADIRVIPNTVQPHEFSITEQELYGFRSRYNFHDDRRHFLYLSRFHPKKRIAELLEWWRQASRDHDYWTLVVAGDGAADEYTLKTRRLARELEKSGQAKLLPFLQGRDKAAAYRSCEAMVLPTESENFGNVVIEALWCGLPVLTTRGTPWGEMANRGAGWWTGIDWEDVTQGVRQMLSCSPDELATMGRRGHDWVATTYVPNVVREQWRTLWRETGVE